MRIKLLDTITNFIVLTEKISYERLLNLNSPTAYNDNGQFWNVWLLCVIKWTLVRVCGCESVTILCPRLCVCMCVGARFQVGWRCACALVCVCNQMFGWLSFSPIVIWLPCIIASWTKVWWTWLKLAGWEAKCRTCIYTKCRECWNNTSHSALTSTVQLPVMYCIIYATCVCPL